MIIAQIADTHLGEVNASDAVFPARAENLQACIADINSLALAGSEIRRQAIMIGYINVFKLFTVLSVLPIPFIWLAKLPRYDR